MILKTFSLVIFLLFNVGAQIAYAATNNDESEGEKITSYYSEEDMKYFAEADKKKRWWAESKGYKKVHLAAAARNLSMMKSLISTSGKKVDINLRAHNGNTPLHLVMRGDHYDGERLLH